MAAVLTLVFVVGISMLITKIATVALMHTGMSRERARFQARSAFTGTGFTTEESEVVIRHPVRRRIITLLIICGNAGLVTAISTLVIGFVNPASDIAQWRNAAILFGASCLLFFLSQSERVDRFLFRTISAALDRFAGIRTRDFSSLLSVTGDYEISELQVRKNEWLAGSSLAQLQLPREGVMVLGIYRKDDKYIGVPRGRYEIKPGDRLIVYGKAEHIAELSKRRGRREGGAEHAERVREHEEELAEQDAALEGQSEDGETSGDGGTKRAQ